MPITSSSWCLSSVGYEAAIYSTAHQRSFVIKCLKELQREDAQKKTWWDCVKNDMESLGLSQKDVQSRNKWRRRVKGQLANPGSPGNMAVKMECVCVCFGADCWCRLKASVAEAEQQQPSGALSIEQIRTRLNQLSAAIGSAPANNALSS